MNIDYVELPALDLDAMAGFYGAAFGWTFEDYGPDYQAFANAGLKAVSTRPIRPRRAAGRW